jgi:protein TonB
MAALAPIATPPPSARRVPPSAEAPLLFASVVGEGLAPTRPGRISTLAISLVFHTVLVLLIVVVPLVFFQEILPVPGDALRAFFVAPPNVAPPPPPPPPAPPAGASALRRAPAAVRPSEPPTFVAPVEVPDVLPPVEEVLDLDVQGGGVPGGVEGGVPGGVVGGIVGGLPSEPAAAQTPKVVRIGGKIIAPKLVTVVKPEYPTLATLARLEGIVILEAFVGVDGKVMEVKPLRGPVILVDAAVEAVKQWRYRPLLLNGAPTQFILTVTVAFDLQEAKVAP